MILQIGWTEFVDHFKGRVALFIDESITSIWISFIELHRVWSTQLQSSTNCTSDYR